MQSMTPSKTTTDGQITKAVSNYRALLEKHAPEFPSEAVQTALGQPGLADKMLAVFRQCVEAVSNLIVRHVTVNRGQKPSDALKATGRNLYVNDEVVKTMPSCNAVEVDVVFFNLGRYVNDADLEKEFELRGLVSADPYSLAKVNQDDPDFADEHPNGTHWKNAEGKWCFATFSRWVDERSVDVGRSDDDWGDSWWFAGLRK